jgi:cell volume regulation protein A
LRGAVGIFIASIPLLVGLPKAHIFFDVGFVVVLVSLLVQGWTIAPAARRLHIALPRTDVIARRTELDLPGQLEQELVGYQVIAGSPYLRRGIRPSWAKLTLVVREGRVLTPEEAGEVGEGDHVYFLAPPDRAQALDRFFVEGSQAPMVVEDFFVPGDATLGALAEIYGVTVDPEHAATSLADYFALRKGRTPRTGDVIPLGPVALVAHTVVEGAVATVGLQLAEPEPVRPKTALNRLRAVLRYIRMKLRPLFYPRT